MKKIFTLYFALLTGLFFVAGAHQVEAAEVKLKMVTMLPSNIQSENHLVVLSKE